MKTLSGYLDAAYTAWLGTAVAVNCCSLSRSSENEVDSSRYQSERPRRIEHQQPRLIPPPNSEPPSRPGTSRGREWADRTKEFASRASSRGRFSARRKLNAYNGPRRPRIGAPSDFRHVAQAMPTRSPATFRPLELSIYREERLSPLLPHFDTLEELPRPPSVITHTRSDSALSFTIPRKPLRASSRASSEWASNFQARPGSISAQDLLANIESELPRVPEQARLRAMTEPPAYERIKSALHEKFELEQRLRDIDEVIEERRSVFFNSRPTSRATSRGPRSIYSDVTRGWFSSSCFIYFIHNQCLTHPSLSPLSQTAWSPPPAAQQ
ncbi:hypothetical protein HYFRA_00001249 [Hymenoscyphus fraxineus]|uniref:Uncharacterized protein n=1 Tax=Hymenoscyphus fraxineus TaxID=746836 RepID=A0A9N9KUZ6_9HELO|nr:hypothetical protein HYFRA_00001249 [Hymenoscyphus fraxineus]